MTGWKASNWAKVILAATSWSLLVAFFFFLTYHGHVQGAGLLVLPLLMIYTYWATRWAGWTWLQYRFERDKCLLLVRRPMQDIMVAARAVLQRRGVHHTLTDRLKGINEPKAPWSRPIVFVPAIQMELGGNDYTLYLNPWRGALTSKTMVSIGPSDTAVEHQLQELLMDIDRELRSTPIGGP